MTVIDLAAAERPRMVHIPRFSTSAGDEAIDLAASAGLHLDPWQQFVLRNSLGERADGRWAAFEVGLIVGRQQGKGAVLEARELAGLVLFGDRLIMHTAHEVKTAKQHFTRFERLIESSEDLRKRLRAVRHGNNDPGLDMRDGSELHIMARSKGSGRGFSGDLVVLDEAYALTADQMDASMPTTLARDNAQVWYTSSPPLDAISGEVLMGIRERGEAGTATRLAWFDYGLAHRLDLIESIDLDDRQHWFAALPSMRSGRVREENVQVLREILTDTGFARELLGMWPPKPSKDGFRVVPEHLWSAACDPESELEGRPAYGVHVVPDRSYSAISAAGARVGGGRHVELTGRDDLDDFRPGTAWIVPRLLDMEQRNPPSVIVIDDKAVADAAEKAGLVVHRANVSDVVTGCQLFYDGIAGADPEGRTLRHLGQKDLTDSVAGAEKRTVGNSWAWVVHDLTAHVSPVASASLALFGHSTPRVQRPPDQPFFGSWR